MNSSTLEIINEIVETAKEKGIAQLIVDDQTLDGRTVTLKGKKLISFGSYSYLHLEIDERLKKASVEAIKKFGISFPSSKAYITNDLYPKLEGLLSEMFDTEQVVITQSLSIGHHGVMPIVINEKDALILDQHVHASVQDASRKIQSNGVVLTMVRHNKIEDLKSKIKELSSKHERVWYAIDSLYSMYGDFAPMQDLVKLLDEYKNFYLYVDDAHGMSVFGENGTGYVMEKTGMHEKMVLAVGMAKGYGVEGGVFIFKNRPLFQRVKNCAGPLIFSGALSIPVLAAGIASAEIHLSSEITVRQTHLKEKITYCHNLIKKYQLPNISDAESPIFFIGLGKLALGYNLVARMIASGFYVNIAAFPAVSKSCTGIRFTITLAHKLEDIKAFVDVLAAHFHLAMDEEQIGFNEIKRAFRKTIDLKEPLAIESIITDYKKQKNNQDSNPEFKIIYRNSIKEIPSDTWDKLFKGKGVFDSQALLIQESAFSGNENKEHNWKFHYLMVLDQEEKPVAATFFSNGWVKDDMLSHKNISKNAEHQRDLDAYHHCSESIMMGSIITEGEHMYLDYSNENWKGALNKMLDFVTEIFHDKNLNQVVLRDFNFDEKILNEYFHDTNFVKVGLPDGHSLALDWQNSESFLATLKKSHRKYIRSQVFKYEELFEVRISSGVKNENESRIIALCNGVIDKNLTLNTFSLPSKFYKEVLNSELWEVIELRIKEGDSSAKKIVAVMLCYKNDGIYTPVFVGLDYDYLYSNIYPQILWQSIKRAKNFGVKTISLGFTASQNKRKFGAVPIRKASFIQLKDTFNSALLSLTPKQSVNS